MKRLGILLLCVFLLMGGTACQSTGHIAPKETKAFTLEQQNIDFISSLNKGEGDHKQSEDVVEMFAAAYQAFPLVENTNGEEQLMKITITNGGPQDFVARGLYLGWLDDGTGYHVQETIEVVKDKENYQVIAMGAVEQTELDTVFYEMIVGTVEQEKRYQLNPGENRYYVLDLLTGKQDDFPKELPEAAVYGSSDINGMIAVAGACRTENAVGTWSAENGWQLHQVDGLLDHIIESVFVNFSDSQHGVFAANADRQMGYYNNLVYYTNDGGTTWNSCTSPIYSPPISCVGISEAGKIFVSYGNITNGSLGSLFCSMDGQNWTEIPLTLPEEQKGFYTVVDDIEFDGQEGTLFMTGGEGSRAKFLSHDGGDSWNFDSVVTQ